MWLGGLRRGGRLGCRRGLSAVLRENEFFHQGRGSVMVFLIFPGIDWLNYPNEFLG
jgi:hypothetical protein